MNQSVDANQADGINTDPTKGIPKELTANSPISEERSCRYCKSIKNPEATVCPECGRDQRWYRNYFRIDHVGLLIALVMIVIAYLQLEEGRRERVAASQTEAFAPSTAPARS
jgi:hypothetical protein